LEGDLPKTGELHNTIDQLNDALVADLHYQLRYSLKAGFETYFRYAEESMLGDKDLSQQLRAELLSQLADERRYAIKQADSQRVDEIDQFMQQKVIPDGAVRWVKWFVHLQNRADKALEITGKLRKGAAHLLEHADELTRADLDCIEGYCQCLQGDIPAANKLLNEALVTRIEHLQDLQSEPIRFNAILARACNNLGYLGRVEGKFIRAEHYYAKAIPLWRFLRMPAQQATTINNHAYVLALLGQFNAARRQALDAYQLREDIGQAELIILSLCTRAEIEIYAGNYREAQVPAEEALRLAQKHDRRRGEGMARLAMAILSRFRSEPENALSVERRYEYLDRALQHSKRATDIFSKESPETERKIKALLEQGLTQREIYRLSLLKGTGDEELFSLSVAKVQSALDEAKVTQNWLLYADAFLSLCWVYYYHPKKRELLPGLLQEIDQIFDLHFPGYKITPDSSPVKNMDTVISAFSQLARMHVLRGILALDAFEKSGKEIPSPALTAAGQEFGIVFEYDALIARDFRDTIRAINLIYTRLKKYNQCEMLEIYKSLQSAPGNFLPSAKPFTDLLLWQLLEEHFGTFEVIQGLIKQPE